MAFVALLAVGLPLGTASVAVPMDVGAEFLRRTFDSTVNFGIGVHDFAEGCSGRHPEGPEDTACDYQIRYRIEPR